MSVVASETTPIAEYLDHAGMPEGTPTGSPLWWAYELEAELNMRSGLIGVMEDYYEGRHKMAFATQTYRAEFAQMLAAVSESWFALIINAWAERMEPTGFSFGEETGDGKGDDDAWHTWQANYLDADSRLAWIESGKHGEAYMLVWPEEHPTGFFSRLFSRRSADTPSRITIEHPAQMVVRREAGDRRRRKAAFKKWREDDGTIMGTLYLPDEIHRYQRTQGTGWVARKGVDASTKHNLGVVPVVPIVNDPQMLPSRPPMSLVVNPHRVNPKAFVGLGRSDVIGEVTTVDQINKLLCDLMIASEFGAFKQRWATGIDIPVDPETGKPLDGAFQAAIDRIWAARGAEGQDVKFGEFSATELDNFDDAITNRISGMAARTSTPATYFPGTVLANISDKSMATMNAGLAAKVKGKKRYGGEGLEEAIRLDFAWRGDARANAVGAEIFWAPSETRSEAELVDSLVKKLSIGVPKEQLWEDAGYSPQKIKRFKTMLLEEAKRIGMFDPGGPDLQPPPDDPGSEEE